MPDDLDGYYQEVIGCQRAIERMKTGVEAQSRTTALTAPTEAMSWDCLILFTWKHRLWKIRRSVAGVVHLSGNM